MPHSGHPSPRKLRLCRLLRTVTHAFIAETDSATDPDVRQESSDLRAEFDGLISHAAATVIEPATLARSGLPPRDPATAPLVGRGG